MSKHISTEQVERYHKRLLPAAELLVVDYHIAECEDCRALLSRAEDLRSSFEFLRADLRSAEKIEHPANDQISAYVDRSLDEVDMEIVESHMEICSRCAADIDVLRSLKTDLKTISNREFLPRAYTKSSLAAQPTPQQRLAKTLRSPFYFIPL